MGNGFPIWFGIAAGIVGFALAEEVTQKTENNTPSVPQVEAPVPGILPRQVFLVPEPLDYITDPVPKSVVLREMEGFWVGVDYLNWRIKNGPLPNPMITSGSLSDAVPGALGQPGTRVLAGGNSSNGMDYGPFSGIRMNGGFFLDDDRIFSFEGSAFLLEQRSYNFSASTSDLQPVVTAPFFNTNGIANSIFATVPDNLTSLPNSTLSIYSYSKLSGGEANAKARFGNPGNGFSSSLLFGGKFTELEENLIYSINSQRSAGGINTGTQGTDQFLTRNWFYGVQVGGGLNYDYKRFHASALGKIALGQTQQNIAISGSRSSTINGSPAGSPTDGFVYALPTNNGMHNQSAFSAIPELQCRLGYDVTKHIQLYAGYDYFYWSSVLRPGNAVDSVINTSQRNGQPLVGAARPEPVMSPSGIWAQGMTFGVELKY
jgi:hypothetical protein